MKQTVSTIDEALRKAMALKNIREVNELIKLLPKTEQDKYKDIWLNRRERKNGTT